jgi:hypothetical protein
MARAGRKKAEATLLRLLACGASAESAARTASVAVRTVHRRLKDPRFQQKLLDAQTQMLQHTSAMATAASAESVKTLLELQGAGNPPGIRLGAARAMLENGLKLRLHAEVERRLAALEAQASQGANPQVSPTDSDAVTHVGVEQRLKAMETRDQQGGDRHAMGTNPDSTPKTGEPPDSTPNPP